MSQALVVQACTSNHYQLVENLNKPPSGGFFIDFFLICKTIEASVFKDIFSPVIGILIM
jgi:hypothetical protein